MSSRIYRPKHAKPQYSADPVRTTDVSLWILVLAGLSLFGLSAYWLYPTVQAATGFSTAEKQQFLRAHQQSYQSRLAVMKTADIEIKLGDKPVKLTAQERERFIQPTNYSTPQVTENLNWMTPAAPKVNQDQVKVWVKSLAQQVNVKPVEGKRQVDRNGRLVKLLADPTPGKQVKNVDQVSDSVAKALSHGLPYRGKLEIEETKPTSSDEPVDYQPTLAFTPKAGQKWIDINLTTHTVTAYIGNDIVYGPFPAVTGHRLAPTATGSFKVYIKLAKQTMSGIGFDGFYSETAPWIMYFNRDFALHAAPWRSTFVYTPETGSHGCVNLPMKDAKWLYDWAEIGTPVSVHH